MNPKLRKIQKDQLITEEPLPHTGYPITVPGFPSPGTGKEQGQRCLAAPLVSDPTQCLHLPQPRLPSEDT